MATTKRLNRWAGVALLTLCVMVTACTPLPPKVEKVKPPITCQQAQYNDYATVSDQQLVQFLDQSIGAENINQCWQPTLSAALQQQRNIPRQHLVHALKMFNHRRDSELFHLAVRQYLTTLSAIDYHHEQRQLLVAYSRYLIEHVSSNADPRLGEVKVLCAELDQGLYRKLFE